MANCYFGYKMYSETICVYFFVSIEINRKGLCDINVRVKPGPLTLIYSLEETCWVGNGCSMLPGSTAHKGRVIFLRPKLGARQVVPDCLKTPKPNLTWRRASENFDCYPEMSKKGMHL